MSVIIYNCYNITLQNVALFDGISRIIGERLLASNIFGKSTIANLISSELVIFYGDNFLVDSQHDHSLTIHSYAFYEYSSDGSPQQEDYLPVNFMSMNPFLKTLTIHVTTITMIQLFLIAETGLNIITKTP